MASGQDKETVATAYQGGGLIGGLGGGIGHSASQSARAAALKGARISSARALQMGIVRAVPELAGGGVGAVYGYTKDGTATSALHWATVGMFAGGIAGGLARGLPSVRRAVAPRDAANPRLFTYSRHPEFVGDVFKVKHAGRAWATRHAPGPWAFEGGLGNFLKRMWRTGRIKPFASVKEITGPAKDLFVRVRAIGPARGWKRIGGQYFTPRPGNVNLATGEILQPTVGHWLRFGADVGVYYTLDGAFLVAGRTVVYVAADQLLGGEQ